MSQNYQLGDENTFLHQYVLGQLNLNQEALRSNFAGAAAPAEMVAGQLFAGTADGYLWIRNTANTALSRVARLDADQVLQLPSIGWNVAVSATRSAALASMPRQCRVRRIVLLSDTLTASDASNEWQVQVRKHEVANPGVPVDLFSAAVGTHTVLANVGGGTELAPNVGVAFVPDQNADCVDLDQLELVLTMVGSATAIGNLQALVEVD